MQYDSDKHHRGTIRLRGYDYTHVGVYFITVCTHNRECLFGSIMDAGMRLNQLGEIVQEEWRRSAVIRSEIQLDAFVVMPNHIHGIVVIASNTDLPHVGAHGRAPLHNHAPLQRPPRSLGSFVAGFKSAVTKRINEIRGTPGTPVWQRNYYEHVIRSDDEMDRVGQYIAENPAGWAEDAENPLGEGIRYVRYV